MRKRDGRRGSSANPRSRRRRRAIPKHNKRDDRRGHHQQQRHHCRHVASRSLAADCHRHGQQRRQRQSLPQEMHECPSQWPHHGWRKPIGKFAHRTFLSYSSNMWRISSSSFREVFRADSACIIKSFAEPANTRCSTSPANWRLVSSAGTTASYTCARCSSLRRTLPLTVIICKSFRTVVYPVSFFSFSAL